MEYLRLKDYNTVIREEALTEILRGDSFIRGALELSAKEKIESYLRHRYNLAKQLNPFTDFSLQNTYYTGDLVKYSEPAYSNTANYVVGSRVSVGGYIYESLYVQVGVPITTAGKWSLITENENLYYAKMETVGNLPTEAYGVVEGDYLTGFEELIGWDRGVTLYFKKEEVSTGAYELRIYTSVSDMNTSTNYIGSITYSENKLKLPSRRPVNGGVNQKICLGGYLTVKDFIPDNETWTVTSENFFTKGDNRNPLLLELFKKIVVYELHNTINPRNLPQLRIDAYTEAINYLKMVAKGEITMDLPIHDLEPEKGQRIIYGTSSNSKYNW